MQAADDAVTARWPDLPGVLVIYHAQAWWPNENSDEAVELTETSELAKISVKLPPRIVMDHIEALVSGESSELDVLHDELYLHTRHPHGGGGPYWIEITDKSHERLQKWWENHEDELRQLTKRA